CAITYYYGFSYGSLDVW
nr:immunoglobulin heavy chain junction region [Macaca mulatta]MOY23501.1 immunoglobulin heavy chain junction region [Macaca mulatta]MOY23636.1 immunoglobulin heavy chain junction region [Macaca mulatta]MOY24091.1 immunoglobulin heavy chain junction region [Macaca mulatta]MOY25218.1 immunoglobulin heavy chain junction region [Macaca mulatta]